MNEEWLLTLALATHGNAALQEAPCPCAFRRPPLSGLSEIRGRQTTFSSLEAWFTALKTQGARRLWLNVFQGAEGAAGGWALEVARSDHAEVWRASPQGDQYRVEQIFTQLPLSERTPQLDEAHKALKVALSESHRVALEARDADLAETLLQARECLDGAGPAEATHLFPETGYGPRARALFRGAQRALQVSPMAPQLQQAVMAAAMAAAHSPGNV